MFRVLISTVLVATSFAKNEACKDKPKCDEGFRPNKDTCVCEAIPICAEACDSGFRQTKECECTSIMTLPKKCPKNKSKPKCPASYKALNDGTCGCELAVDVCDFKIECPYG